MSAGYWTWAWRGREAEEEEWRRKSQRQVKGKVAEQQEEERSYHVQGEGLCYGSVRSEQRRVSVVEGDNRQVTDPVNVGQQLQL